MDGWEGHSRHSRIPSAVNCGRSPKQDPVKVQKAHISDSWAVKVVSPIFSLVGVGWERCGSPPRI